MVGSPFGFGVAAALYLRIANKATDAKLFITRHADFTASAVPFQREGNFPPLSF